MVAADRRPSVSDAVIADSGFHRAGIACAVIKTDEFIAARIEAAYVLVYMEHRVMVPALAVFGLVVYGAALDFHLAYGKIPLEV